MIFSLQNLTLMDQEDDQVFLINVHSFSLYFPVFQYFV